MSKPALLGGAPAFPDGLAMVRPSLPSLERVMRRLQPSWDTGHITNGRLVRDLEAAAAERLGTRHAVAVSSCTSGLLLVLQALRLDGPVVLPSFTFSASAHAVRWNGLPLRFAECDPDTFQLDPVDTAARLGGAAAVMPTHVFGAPAAVEAIAAAADAAGIPVVFDAAHGFGTLRGGRPVTAFGRASVVSLTPTKPLVAGEGGLVATDDGELAATLRVARDYGNPGDYDPRFAGLNARMSELHAALALESLADFEASLERRQTVAARYRDALAGVPGVRLQALDPADRSTWKDLTIAVDPTRLGVDRDTLVRALAADGIDTRRYFSPPIHRQQAYAAEGAVTHLPVTEALAATVVSLPMYPDLAADAIERVVEVIGAVHTHADEINATAA